MRVSDLEAIAPNLRMNVAVVFPDSANVTDDSQVLASATLKSKQELLYTSRVVDCSLESI